MVVVLVVVVLVLVVLVLVVVLVLLLVLLLLLLLLPLLTLPRGIPLQDGDKGSTRSYALRLSLIYRYTTHKKKLQQPACVCESLGNPWCSRSR